MSVEYIIENNNLPLLEQLVPLMEMRLRNALHEIALILEAGATDAIKIQMAPDGTPWAALSDWYVAWKAAKGYSDAIYIMTSSYQQAITSHVSEEELVALVGVMRDAGETPDGRAEIWEIAELLEYGAEKFNTMIPARPIWRPLLEIKRRSIQTRIGTAIYWAAKTIEKQAKGKVL
jgi:hypothetical protein